MFLKKNYQLLILFLIAVSLSFVFHNFSNLMAQDVQKDKSINSSLIQACIPKATSTSKQTLISRVTEKEKIFYLFRLVQQKNDPWFEGEKEIAEDYIGILQDSLGCVVVIPPESSLKRSWTQSVPLAVARQFALDSLKFKVAEAGGKEKFLKQFNTGILDGAMGPYIFFPEDEWAFNQIGIKLPNPHVIVNDVDEVKAPDLGN